MKISKNLKAFVKNCIDRHRYNIYAGEYTIDVEYAADDKPGDDPGAGAHVMGEMIVDRRYLKATLRLYPKALNYYYDGNRDTLEDIIAHEVCHIATEHMKDLIYSCFKDEGEVKDAWESLTQRLSYMSLAIDQLRQKK